MEKGIVILICVLCLWSCQDSKARWYVSKQSGSYISESVERNKELIAEEEAFIKKLIAQDTTHTYLSSEDGFWYTYNIQDTIPTKQPVKGDVVTFSYDLQTLSGTTIVSKEEIGIQAMKIDQSNQELISGIRDGLKILKEGESITLLFPSHKAYGYYGFENKIGSNLPIKSTVTLLKIEKNNQPE